MLQSHTPPIHPSPARLGLSNAAAAGSPSLPSNPNPNPTNPSNPNPNPKQPSIPTSTSTPISSSLLPLLPPLPRAQALLLQMSSLASRLFDLSPHRSLWLSSFRGSLPSFLPSSPSLPSTTPPLSSIKDALSLFTSLQTQLFEAVAELQEIIDLQNSTAKLSREVRSLDSTLLSFSRKLRESERVLDHLLDDYSHYRCPAKRHKLDKDQDQDQDSAISLRSSLDLSDVLAYAHRISYTTFAPPEHAAGQPLRAALPPAPLEGEMRASQLYNFANLDVGVPPKGVLETKERLADVLTEPLMQPTPPREEQPMPASIVPPMLPIALPPGWRKGTPVELPKDLPPVPPGWKPGDPVPLPPLEGIVIGSRGEEQKVGGVPGMPGAAPKAPEAIQVKYVELDINPDQDDYSSDYSSEVGSSDEDDED